MQSSDGDKTIDGENPRPKLEPTPITPQPARDDYPELTAVERHHYVVSAEIAKGGMGRVFEARDLRLGRQVAIKELLPRNRDAAKRFEREARITARLQHPAIIHVYEAGVWPGGEPFYAMPMVAGRSLDKVVAERHTLVERLGLLPNVIAIADALAYAHSEHVIHRDLKPSNVLVGEFGETVVIDWGLAKDLRSVVLDPKESMQLRVREEGETVSGSVVGTPAYMPPEQARGEPLDQRADVYALGALLYKVLAGHAPYTGDSSKAILAKVKAGPPPPIVEHAPGAPRDLVAIVEKAMARDPADRYETANEVAQDLKRFQTGQLVAAHQYTRSQLAWRFLKRHRVAIVIGATSLVALATVGIVSVQRIIAEKREADDKRITLLEERGRAELFAEHPGLALPYLVEAAREGGVTGARGFLLADALRPFSAQVERMSLGSPTVRIAVSPDGMHVAAGGKGPVRMWSVEGKPEQTLPNASVIRSLAFDATGTRIAAGDEDGATRIWTRDGRELRLAHVHRGPVNDVAFSPDGTLVATAGDDGLAVISDALTGAFRSKSECHTGPVDIVRFAPDGQHIATASVDKNACVLDLDGNRTSRLRAHNAAVTSVRWHPDSRLVITASEDGDARVWRALVGRPAVEPMRHERQAPLYAAEISADGKFVVTTGADGEARVWELPAVTPDPPDGQRGADAPLPSANLIAKLAGHSDKVLAAAWSSDDTRVVTAGRDRRSVVWEVSTVPAIAKVVHPDDAELGDERVVVAPQPIAAFEHPDVVQDVAFAVGHKRVLTASRDGSAHIWDIDRGVVKRWEMHSDSEVRALAIAADGTLAIGAEDSNVTLWREPEQQTLEHGHLSRVNALAFDRTGSVLVSAGEDPTPIVWDAKTGVRVRTLGEQPEPTTSIAISYDGTTVATAAGGVVRLWQLATGTSIATLELAGSAIDVLAFDANGYLVGGGVDKSLAVWNPRRELVTNTKQRSPITALALSPDGKTLLVAGQGEALIYRVAAGKLVGAPLSIDGPTGDVRACALSPDGSLAFTAGDDGSAKIWDVAKGKLLGTRAPHGKQLTSLALSRDGTKLWIADAGGTITEWDVHVERSDVSDFVTTHVPWRLGEDDVVIRTDTQGAGNGQR